MSTLDISLLIILAGFILNGLFKGIIRLVGHIVGLVLGAYLAVNFYLGFYNWFKDWSWLKVWVSGHQNLTKILAFIIFFIVAVRLIDLFFVLLEKIFKFMAVIPGSKYLNNLLGGVLGFIEGALFLGIIIYALAKYSFVNNFLGGQLSTSIVAPWLLKTVDIFKPLLPRALRGLQSFI